MGNLFLCKCEGCRVDRLTGGGVDYYCMCRDQGVQLSGEYVGCSGVVDMYNCASVGAETSILLCRVFSFYQSVTGGASLDRFSCDNPSQ